MPPGSWRKRCGKKTGGGDEARPTAELKAAGENRDRLRSGLEYDGEARARAEIGQLEQEGRAAEGVGGGVSGTGDGPHRPDSPGEEH
ncbi:MAG: hypothetical protein V8Q30_05540 [Acutalibacteraceae bacterium]